MKDSPPKIRILDESLSQVMNLDAEVEVLAEGFRWSEGPIWIEEFEFLLFSDVPANIVYQWSENNGLKEYLNPSGYTGKLSDEEHPSKEKGSNGLSINSEGELILCQHGDRRVAKMTSSITSPQPIYQTIADNFKGIKFNSPNDLVYHKNGDLYFTDPPYGLSDGYDDSPRKELDFNGVYRVKKNGEIIVVDKDLSRPNGLAFSPGFDKLYVSNSDPANAIWKVFDVNRDGDLSNGRVFFNATSLIEKKYKGLPDGLKVDDNGNLYGTGPGGVLIISSEGKHLGTIDTGKATANCGFNKDKSILYITADNLLMRIKVK